MAQGPRMAQLRGGSGNKHLLSAGTRQDSGVEK